MNGAWEPTKTGVPQGGVASPLWSNIYPDALRSCHDRGRVSGDALGGRLRRCLPAPVRRPRPPWPMARSFLRDEARG